MPKIDLELWILVHGGAEALADGTDQQGWAVFMAALRYYLWRRQEWAIENPMAGFAQWGARGLESSDRRILKVIQPLMAADGPVVPEDVGIFAGPRKRKHGLGPRPGTHRRYEAALGRVLAAWREYLESGTGYSDIRKMLTGALVREAQALTKTTAKWEEIFREEIERLVLEGDDG